MFFYVNLYDYIISTFKIFSVYFYFYFIISVYCYKKKKNDPWSTMGKNIKSYATIPKVHFPREREGYLTAKSPNLLAKIWYGLTVHIHFFIFLNLQSTSKIFQIYVCLLAKFPVNYANFTQFAPESHE